MSNNYLSKVSKLFEAMGGDEMLCQGAKEQFSFFPKYVNAVIDYIIQNEMIKCSSASFDQRRHEIEAIDVARKLAHDAAISAITTLNRWCDMFGIERLADVDTTDRYAVADFVGDFVLELYKGEINGKGMDHAVAEANGEHYDKIDSVMDRFEK